MLHTTAAGSLFGVGAGIALVLIVLSAAVLMRTDLGRLGLADGGVRSSLRVGFLIGGSVALVGGVGILAGGQVVELQAVTPAASLTWADVLWRALLLLWVDTILPEELAFRGALLLALGGSTLTASAQPSGSYRCLWIAVARAAIQPAVLVSSVVFAAAHVVVVTHEGTPDLPTVAGKLVFIAFGGLLFGALRVVSGNLLAPMIGHWLFNLVAMIAALASVSI